MFVGKSTLRLSRDDVRVALQEFIDKRVTRAVVKVTEWQAITTTSLNASMGQIFEVDVEPKPNDDD